MSADPTIEHHTFAPDLVAQLAGLAPDDSVSALRAARADATRFTQGSHDALFSEDVANLTLTERLFAAWYVAWLTPAPEAAQMYRVRLLATVEDTQTTAEWLDILSARGLDGFKAVETQAGPRLSAILTHTHALITQPAATGKTALSALQTTGLTTRAIVALAQLIAFVSYQVRVVAALQALKSSPSRSNPKEQRA
jgi:CMD domain protein